MRVSTPGFLSGILEMGERQPVNGSFARGYPALQEE